MNTTFQLKIREHAQDVPIPFIANEDIEIVESNDGEDSEMMTPIGNSDWNYYHVTNIINEIINDKILLIINNVD